MAQEVTCNRDVIFERKAGVSYFIGCASRCFFPVPQFVIKFPEFFCPVSVSLLLFFKISHQVQTS